MLINNKKTMLTETKLTQKIKDKFGYSFIESRQLIEFIEEEIVKTIISGGLVKLWEFGKFEQRTRKGRVCPHPRKKGETIVLPPMKVVKFTASIRFKDRVRDGG